MGIIVVVGHGDRVIIDVIQKPARIFGKPCLGVTHGSRRVIVDRTVIAVHIDQRNIDLPVLRHPDHRFIDGRITMRMEGTHDASYRLGGLAVRLFVDVAVDIHRI